MSKSLVRQLLLLALALLIALAVFCALPRAFPPPAPTAFSPDNPPGEPCAFVPAGQSLPELSEQLLSRLQEAGLPAAAAHAEAYGEDCRYSDGTSARFAARETDYRLMLNVENLTNTETLGSLLEQTLNVLDEFPVTETPGPNPGYIGITFQAGLEAENLWFQRAQSDTLRAQGLSGSQLYEALKNK